MKVEKQWCNMTESWCSHDQLSCGILYPLEFQGENYLNSGGHIVDCYNDLLHKLSKHELVIRWLGDLNIYIWHFWCLLFVRLTTSQHIGSRNLELHVIRISQLSWLRVIGALRFTPQWLIIITTCLCYEYYILH